MNRHSAAKIPKTAEKEYLAVVSGKTEKCGTIDKPIYRPDPMKTLRAVGEQGDRAVTHWKTLATDGEKSLVRVWLETGRTHQIRAHFASIGHPLLGDGKYGTNKLNKDFGYRKQCLYSYKLVFMFDESAGILSYLHSREFEVKDVWFKREFENGTL